MFNFGQFYLGCVFKSQMHWWHEQAGGPPGPRHAILTNQGLLARAINIYIYMYIEIRLTARVEISLLKIYVCMVLADPENKQ